MNLLIYIYFILFLTSCKSNTNIAIDQNGQLNIGDEVQDMDTDIWAIYQSRDGIYWFGGNGSGVFAYDGETLRNIRTQHGLANNTVRGIQEDKDGNIYIETPSGVSRYDGETISTLPVVFSKSWNLRANDLWFGCNGRGNFIFRYSNDTLYRLELPEEDISNKLDIKEINDDLSPYAVFGIDKDRDGNLWIGTVEAGAFCYDGEKFLWIGEKELSTLPDGRVPGVRSMLQDKDGYMWLSNFFSKYKLENNNKTYKKVKSVARDHPLLQDKIGYFNSGIVADNGDLYMITYRGGIWKYDGKQLTNQEITHKDVDEVLLLTIHQDNEGKLWVGTRNAGVFYQKDGMWQRFME